MTARRFEAADLLDEAADYLEAHGWIQGHLSTHEGLCAVGALQRVTGDRSGPNILGLELAARRLLAAHIEAEVTLNDLLTTSALTAGSTIVRWNDHPDRTASDVITAMRKTALTAREHA